MNSWSRSREVEKVKKASQLVGDGHVSIHIFEVDGEWQVWLNNQSEDFTGLCVCVGSTRDEAVAQAVAIFESVTDHLQQPESK